MPDPFSGDRINLNDPATFAAAITPHNSNSLPDTPRALYIGTGGTLVLIPAGQTTSVTLVNVASGQVLPIRATHVLATGTTATNIVALW